MDPKQFWLQKYLDNKIESKKVLDTETYWLQINVRSKDILSPKFCRAQQNLSLKKYWVPKKSEKNEFSKKISPLKCLLQQMLCQKKCGFTQIGQK